MIGRDKYIMNYMAKWKELYDNINYDTSYKLEKVLMLEAEK